MSSTNQEAEGEIREGAEVVPIGGLAPDADLRGKDMRGHDLRGNSFKGRDLTGVQLEGARGEEVDLRDASLANANLSGALLEGAILSGADLSGADLSGADLRSANLDGTNLDHAILQDTCLAGAQVRDARWSGVEARGGDWKGADLSGSAFQKTVLEDVDLRGARLHGVRVDDSDWARIGLVETEGTDLRFNDCTLADLDLNDARLPKLQVRFVNADRLDWLRTRIDGALFESVAFQGGRFVEPQALGARFVRCVGLDRQTSDELRAAGAAVPLNLFVRLWRASADIPGARVLGTALLVVALGLGLRGAGVGGAPSTPDVEPEPEIEIEGLGETARAQWIQLQAQYAAEPQRGPVLLLEMGALLEEEERLGEAEEKYWEAVELSDRLPGASSHPARVRLARLLVSQERFAEAFDLSLGIIQAADRAERQIPGYLLASRARSGAGDREGAVAELSTVTHLIAAAGRPMVEFRLEVAQLLGELGELSAAVSILPVELETLSQEERARMLLAQARLHQRAGNTALAVSTYDRVLVEFPGQARVVVEAQEARSQVLSMGMDPETEARRLELLAAAEDPSLAMQGELGLARLAVRRGDREGAIVVYRRILGRFESLPQHLVEPTTELADLYRSAGAVEQALELLRVAENRQPVGEWRVDLRESRADLLVVQGDFRGAALVLQATLSDYPSDPEVRARTFLRLAGIADAEGAVDRALDLYGRVGAAEVDSGMRAAGVFGSATLLRRVGRVEEALPEMDRAFELLPRRHNLRGRIAVERAEVLVELGRASVAELEAMLSEAREGGIAADSPTVYAELLLLLANALASEDRQEDALRLYRRVTESPAASEDPSLRQVGTEGAVAALVALGRHDEAEGLLGSTSAVGLSRGEAGADCEARRSLIRGKAELRDYQAVVLGLEALFERCRSPRFLVATLPEAADILVEGGLPGEAQRILQQVEVAEIGPIGQQAVALELGRMGISGGLDRAMKGPDPALGALARVERAKELADEGRLAEAEPLWLAVLDDPSSEPIPRSLALLGMGRLEAARGSNSSARMHLQAALAASQEEWIREKVRSQLEALGAEERSFAP